MTADAATSRLASLDAVLQDCAPAAVAVSGGIDSMTLAFIARRLLGARVRMFHAVSPAVPPSATARVERYAAAEDWRLALIGAGELEDARYVANPANRCFYCKQNLYGTIAAHGGDRILSGTNLDDLRDWRPGLAAAAEHAVLHPYVEAGIDKAGVRALARHFGLDDIAELPAAPCLSSRVETGIAIAPGLLRFVDAAEELVQRALAPHTVRCRIRRSGITVELDAETHARTGGAAQSAVCAEIEGLARRRGIGGSVEFAPYRRGSAFLREDA